MDNSLLVYTSDNTLYHYLVIPTTDTIKLHLCGSIAFTGIIATPSAVRMLSWLIPTAQKREWSRYLHDLTYAELVYFNRTRRSGRRLGCSDRTDGCWRTIDFIEASEGMVLYTFRMSFLTS